MPAVVLAPIHTRLLNTWRVLDSDATAPTALTGIAAETTLQFYDLPGGSMGPNGILKITTLWSFTGTGNKVPRVRFGGVSFLGPTVTTNLSMRAQTIIENRNNAAVQVAFTDQTPNTFSQQAAAVATAAVDTTTDKTIGITGQVSVAGETMKLESHLIEILYGA